MLSCFLPVLNFLRIAIPIISLFGSAPTFFILWFLLRLITLICFPRHIYRRCDDYLYSLYQRFVLFFFENWVNVKV
jgi:lysophosphatidate acyltransferase